MQAKHAVVVLIIDEMGEGKQDTPIPSVMRF